MIKNMNNAGYPTIFHLISDVSKKTGATCILIGGFAINFYNVTRQTADVDFLITKEDFEKMMPVLKSIGYKEDYVQDVFTRLKGNEIYLMDIDFMFIDKDTLDKIIKDSKEINIAKQRNGPTKTINLTFFPNYTRFTAYTDRSYQESEEVF